jgi:hypothetical protein
VAFLREFEQAFGGLRRTERTGRLRVIAILTVTVRRALIALFARLARFTLFAWLTGLLLMAIATLRLLRLGLRLTTFHRLATGCGSRTSGRTRLTLKLATLPPAKTARWALTLIATLLSGIAITAWAVTII